MATLTLTAKDLVLALTAREKVAGLHGDLRIPLDAVAAVRVVPDTLAAVHGLRAPGLDLPGRARIGTWWRRGGRWFVVAHRGREGLQVTLRGHRLAGLVVALPDAGEHLRALEAARRCRAAVSQAEVAFTSGGLRLAGTLATPRDREPVAAALILPGSGQVDRDADHARLPLGVSSDLAVSLAARGIASLRYDKRGVGASAGDFYAAGLSDNVDDARAALDWLRSAGSGASRPTFVVGHSEGGIIAELVAAGDDRLDGVVLLAAPGTTGTELMAWQGRQVADALPPVTRAVVRLARIDLARLQQRSIARVQASTADTVRMAGRRVNARWQRELLAFDPVPALRRITAPVLALTGEKDLQVDPADLDVIRDTVAGPVEVHRVPDLTHLLRRDPERPNLAAYSALVRRPTDAEVLETVGAWMEQRVRATA
ncbi:alpha/beta hydrolase [Citricoccus sp. SGAir0253]|uniref:alpha/beta hydrolase n=1 Tax=Citricoccus sp. SGAir0253 TaxID=2567881 RepID=UPI0010CCC60A|nr:alpha/beta hydrolase [Citricoccus sp. SGAir0253]QCU79185.1 alpha/beta hydrolase [Citricoccus sp. SGAir0253]